MPYDTREQAQKEYTLKVPQHHHCRKCGNAFIGEGYYCSENCRKTDGDAAKKSLRKYMVICGVLWVVTIAAILIVGI
ncbi:MAG: DUF2116 family Zn-ribbon domain-containing protein [archaeon]|nr:DUF2116 family Zn-ribbon domain-containing protein [archaeon]